MIVTAHFGLGFVLGSYAQELIQRVSGPLIVVLLFVVVAVGGWFVLRMRARRANRADTYECWADCSCPACVAIVATGSGSQPVGA